MFGLWRTWQHFGIPNSIPDLTADSVGALAAHRAKLPRVGAFPFLVAETRNGKWRTVEFMSPVTGDPQRRKDPHIYDEVRDGTRPVTNTAGRIIEDLEHPETTEWVSSTE